MRKMCARLLSRIFLVSDVCVDFAIHVILGDADDARDVSMFKYAVCLCVTLSLFTIMLACVVLLVAGGIAILVYAVFSAVTTCPRASLCVAAAFAAVFCFAVARKTVGRRLERSQCD